MMIYGLKIQTSPMLTDTKLETRHRSWHERLLGRPWRPWVSEDTSLRRVPSNRVLRVGDVLWMHPATFERLRYELRDLPPDDPRWQALEGRLGDGNAL